LLDGRPVLSSADWKLNCLNCGTSLSGVYCSSCGQRAAPPHPSLREVVVEAFSEFSGWDNKVVATLRALIQKPGKLTIEFVEGRRARYVSPLRLYLTCSVVYFLVAAAVPATSQSRVVALTGTAGTVPSGKPVRSSRAGDLTDEDRREIARMLDKAPPILRLLMRRVSNDPAGLQRDIFAALPKGLFALLPAFAAIVAVFYRRRHFAEHLYFALHLHAFVFVALTLTELAKFTRLVPLQILAGVVFLVTLPVYTLCAFQRVYGDRWPRVLMKGVGIAALYAAASIPVVFALAIWVSAA